MFDSSNEDIRNIMQRDPKIFLLTNEYLKSKIETLAGGAFGGDMQKANIVIQKQPQILEYKINETVLPKVLYLRDDLFQGDDAAVQDFLLRCPRILTLSLNETIVARAEALQRFGLDPREAISTWSGFTKKKFEDWFRKKTGQRLPENWCQSVNQGAWLTFDKKVKRIVTMFEEELGMDGDDANRLIKRATEIKQRSVNHLKEVLHYLISLGFSKEDVSFMILKYPRLLTGSLENNMKPSVCFFRQEVFPGNDEKTDAAFRRAIMSRPNLLNGDSLKLRIIPRVTEAKAAGIDVSQVNLGTMMCSNKRYPAWLANNRDKFSPQSEA